VTLQAVLVHLFCIFHTFESDVQSTLNRDSVSKRGRLCCVSFGNDITSVDDDDYDLFANVMKCHSQSAAILPDTQLEHEINDNKTVK